MNQGGNLRLRGGSKSFVESSDAGATSDVPLRPLTIDGLLMLDIDHLSTRRGGECGGGCVSAVSSYEGVRAAASLSQEAGHIQPDGVWLAGRHQLALHISTQAHDQAVPVKASGSISGRFMSLPDEQQQQQQVESSTRADIRPQSDLRLPSTLCLQQAKAHLAYNEVYERRRHFLAHDEVYDRRRHILLVMRCMIGVGTILLMMRDRHCIAHDKVHDRRRHYLAYNEMYGRSRRYLAYDEVYDRSRRYLAHDERCVAHDKVHDRSRRYLAYDE
eukprot:scaffold155861_cov22-Tisochrysis_lutea.AAC.3